MIKLKNILTEDHFKKGDKVTYIGKKTIFTKLDPNKVYSVQDVVPDGHGDHTYLVNQYPVKAKDLKKEGKVNEDDLPPDDKAVGTQVTLPTDEPVILRAGTDEHARGLIVTYKSSGGYDVQYWYGTPDKVVPAELKGDGKSLGQVKTAWVGYHASIDKVKESKMIKLKNILNEVNKSDVKYAMKLAFDSVPGNWHKALKSVNIYGKEIGLVMSSYMGPNKTLQAIVDKFNTSMGTKFKIDKDSFEKGHNTSIRLREGKLNEYGGSDFSKITSLQNYLTIDLDKFEKGLKDSKHKAIYKKARKQFMKTVSGVAWEHSKLHEGKLTEATDQKLAKLFQASKSANVKMGEDKLYKLSQAWERWNVDNDDKYDNLVDPLFAAIELVQDAGQPGKNNVVKDKEYYSYIKSADKHLKQFNKDVVKAMRLHK